MYWVVARFFGFVVALFYRQRLLDGPPVPAGPVVLVGNHPNGLIDPVLVMRAAGRPVRFLAKHPLFKLPVIGQLLRWVRALPVYRAQDGASGAENRGTFAAVHAALGAGDCICLFPEGISHNEPTLQPLKTGAARMALGAEAESSVGLGVSVVPVGLIYRDKATFRSEVAIQTGEPIVLAADWRARHAAAPRETAQALTALIGERIRSVTLNLDAWADLPLLDLAGRIWRDADDPAVRLRAFAEGQRSFLAREPARIDALRLRVLAFAADLASLGLNAEHLDALDRPLNVGRALRFAGRQALALLIGLPVALLGAIAYFVPYQAVRLVAWALHPDLDVVATVKV
ncbi:MAG: 1-acyl-sn-glycerol-3-phosphate acyltransferase, partial [Myxococcales bacterium]|nr:1-acyl-sn-glycerol-3-phosphate acyltransferase [Myxococcales bacterium]